MTTDRPVRVRLFVEASSNNVAEIPRADWDARTPVERRTMLDDLVEAEISNAVDAGYQLLDPADEEGIR